MCVIDTCMYVRAACVRYAHSHAGVKLRDRAGRVVRWKNRKYIYRYACMVVWEMS